MLQGVFVVDLMCRVVDLHTHRREQVNSRSGLMCLSPLTDIKSGTRTTSLPRFTTDGNFLNPSRDCHYDGIISRALHFLNHHWGEHGGEPKLFDVSFVELKGGGTHARDLLETGGHAGKKIGAGGSRKTEIDPKIVRRKYLLC